MRPYLIGLANAAVSGLATGVAASSIFHGTWKQVASAVAIAMGVSAAKWFLQHPIPGGVNGSQSGSQGKG